MTDQQTQIVDMNGHKVAVSADMTFVDGGRGPGAYDAIHYRGFDIVTNDSDDAEPPRFYVYEEGVGEILGGTFANLDAVRIFIDARLA